MISFNEEGLRVCNAKVKFAFLGPIDGCLWYQIGFDTESGTYMTPKSCVGSPEQILNILNTTEVRSWEELPKKFARVKINDDGVVVAIGNLIQSRWLYIAEAPKCQ